jgi:glycosyltransferase involved in cell wall biosynthesis
VNRDWAATVRFFGHLARDLVGTARERWRRFRRRVVDGAGEATVGVDIYPFCETKTGVGWYEWNLLEALDRRDDGLWFNLYAHTFLAASEPPAPDVPGSRRLRLRVHQLPAGFALSEARTLAVLRGVVEPLLRILDGNDVLWAPNFFLHEAQLPYGDSVVPTVHDLAFAAMPEVVADGTLAGLRERLPDTLQRASRLIAVSDATAGDLERLLGVSGRRVHTVHEGLDPRFAAAAERSTRPGPSTLPERYLLFVSTLEPRKNVVGVLRAFRHLAEGGYPGSLVLVGRWGWRTEPIRAELARSPVAGRVVQLDYVERSDLPELYRRADALLFPSWLEGFGLPLLEAMACGAPVVTSDRSSMPEVAGDAALLVDPSDPERIATAVAVLLADAGLRRRLVDAGTRRVARFTWDRAAAATAEVLRQAAGLDPRLDDEYRVK